MNSENRAWDVLIAGAGPAGSTAATLLSEQGLSVLVLEKDEFPRFHIGESLLPASEIIESLLGVNPDPNIFLYKRGAQFVCEKSNRLQCFDFGEALPGPQRYAWHVDRAKFDTLLRDRAREAGADIRHGIRVQDITIENEQVNVQTADQILQARYFIDATGQGRLLAAKMKSAEPFRKLGKAAVFTHFSKLTEQAWKHIAPHNDIRIVMHDTGWAWVIPLTGQRLSVGVVSQRQGLKPEILDDFIEHSPLVQQLVDGAVRGENRMIGNFSFKNTQAFGKRYACIGDAACFIDPVFSSGVSLAIHSAALIAERVGPALQEGSESDPKLMQAIADKLERGYDTFSSLVYRFYNTKFVDNMIFGAPSDGQLRPGVISVLAGDVFRNDNPFQKMLLSSRKGWEHTLHASHAMEAAKS